VKEHIASLKKAVGDTDPEGAVNQRLTELARVVAVEQNKPAATEEELEAQLMRVDEQKIARLTKLVGGRSAEIDHAMSELSAAIKGHSTAIIVSKRLAALETALGEQPTQRVQDMMKELKDVVVDGSGAEHSGSDSDGDGGKLLKQRVAELGIAEEELAALEQGQNPGPVPAVPQADGGTAATKMDHVLSQKIALRGVTTGGLDGDEPREALARAIAAVIGATADAISIDHITDAPVTRRRRLPSLFAVDIAYRVSLTSASVAETVFSRMSDLFANVPSVVKKLTGKLAKSDGLKAKATEKFADTADDQNDAADESDAIAFVKATTPVWDQHKHDDVVSNMKRVEAAVTDTLHAVEHVEASLFVYDHMGSGITYRKPFEEVPEVFVGPPTMVGGHSVTSRLRSSDVRGAHAWLSEPEDQGYDLWHLKERGSWLSLTQGVHTTDEGTKFEVVSCIITGRRLDKCKHSLGGQTGKTTWVAIAQVANLATPHLETQGQKDRDPEFKRVYLQVNDGDGSVTLTQQSGTWSNIHKDAHKFNGTATTVSVLFIPQGKGHINGKAYIATRMKVQHTGTALAYGKEFDGALPAVFMSSENRGGDPYTLRLKKRDQWNKKGCEVVADEGTLSRSKDKHHVAEKAQVLILEV
jgi:hypothetical protein